MLLQRHLAILVLFILPDISLLREEARTSSPISSLQENLQNCVASVPSRKVHIEIAANGILRYYVTYKSGKEEVFSLNLAHYKDLTYLGTAQSGVMVIHAKDDQVIAQTYHDPKGDTDSLNTEMQIQVEGVSAEQINSIHQDLNILKISLAKNPSQKGR